MRKIRDENVVRIKCDYYDDILWIDIENRLWNTLWGPICNQVRDTINDERRLHFEK